MKKTSFPLLRSLNDLEWDEIKALNCLRSASYTKNAVIYRTGETVHEIGIVAKGSVNIENIDLWGNRSILSNIASGQVFAETYALCREPMMVDAVAAEECSVFFLDIKVLLDTGNTGRSWFDKLLRNLLDASTHKNLALSERIFFTSAKTIRGRLCTYLSAQAVKAGKTDFAIPFSRQQLADYLNLDRSALSKELGKMRSEGLIEFRKNIFKLKKQILLKDPC